jgi:hypothetical protein
MRIKPNTKTARSYVSRDKLVGEVENLINSLGGSAAVHRINWVDVPFVDEKNGKERWTAVVFLPDGYTYMVRPIAEFGFHVTN